MKEFFDSFLLGEPLWALLFLLLPLVIWIKRKILNHKSRLLFPSLSLQMEANQIQSNRWNWLPFLGRIMAFSFLIFALCRPQLDQSTNTILSSGVDIVLAVDLSASMLALDMSETDSLEVTRLDVVKDVLKEFIEQRKNDRIGVVAFSVDPYLVSALTLDKEHLQRNLDRLRVGLTHQTGTNIGSALAEGINRLRSLESKSKILILLTDGKDEPAPAHSPLIYAHGAKADEIKIYTIAIGTNTRTPTYLFDSSTRDILRAPNGTPVIRVADYPVDKEILQEIAQTTGALFFEAENKATLQSIYEEIDRLEKSEVEMGVNALFEDLYIWPIAAALLCLCLEFILARTRYLRIP
jgi:Ca-activated chloride channel family protein